MRPTKHSSAKSSANKTETTQTHTRIMFSLLAGLYQTITQKTQYNVLLIGLDNAGKTTFLERLKDMYTDSKGLQPHQITSTTGLNVCKFIFNGANFIVWDLGGRTDVRSIWREYLSECHAVLFMIDGNDRTRLEESKKALLDTLQDEKVTNDVPVMLLVNYKNSTSQTGQMVAKQHHAQEKEQQQKQIEEGEKGSSLSDENDKDQTHANDHLVVKTRISLEEVHDVMGVVDISQATNRHIAIKSISAMHGEGFSDCLSYLYDYLKINARTVDENYI